MLGANRSSFNSKWSKERQKKCLVADPDEEDPTREKKPDPDPTEKVDSNLIVKENWIRTHV